MNASLDVTITLDRYDRHFPFFDGTVKAPVGVRYSALQVGQSDEKPRIEVVSARGFARGTDDREGSGVI
jgi:hypothetical protein